MADDGIILDPLEIEQRSFALIDAEVGQHHYDDHQWSIVRRIIHTTADFDFATITCFAPQAIAAGIAALRRGEKVLCDTNMVRAGVNKTRLASFGSELLCHVADPEIAELAHRQGVTRSLLAMRRGVAEGCGLFLIGNAPTALFALLDLVRSGQVKPALVVGVPVGFVGAAEAKEALIASGLPFISCRGRKGGSAIAATIFNALMILAETER